MSIFLPSSIYQLLNYARNMHLRANLSGQETCCIDSGFNHVASASGCASSGTRHVPCGGRKGNYELMCIYFVGLCIVLLTADRRFVPGTTFEVGRPTFQSDSFLTHAFCTAVLI